jgi:hypothetical protein
LNYEQAKESIRIAYALINDTPTDRLDYINKTLKLLTVLNGGAVFLNEVAMSPHLHEFTEEELAYIHESFCDSATPLIEMIKHFNEKAEREAKEHSFAV